ncbi:hypothetical protein O3G_MSEX001927 [Manduca sexta]|uniref:Uncharacterized protein n=1 Tax=Manduca sexta TaxID=7130 RepID=A0A921YMB0_MANSE|nr:hypothetical protein O3G_MSEX001927 [Manduca sexta]
MNNASVRIFSKFNMFNENIQGLILIILLGIVHCGLLPRRRPHPPKFKPPPQLPPQVREKGQKIMTNLRIPNQRFCSQMDLGPENQYMVLPWWYHYCQNLKEKKERGYNKSTHLAMFKHILDAVNTYKKKMAKDNTHRDLQMLV